MAPGPGGPAPVPLVRRRPLDEPRGRRRRRLHRRRDHRMKLFAFVKRKEGMSREDFLEYWHTQHGPMIRDTPALGGKTLSYVQYPAAPQDQSGWDGVAVQEFASWDSFLAMLSGPAGDM